MFYRISGQISWFACISSSGWQPTASWETCVDLQVMREVSCTCRARTVHWVQTGWTKDQLKLDSFRYWYLVYVDIWCMLIFGVCWYLVYAYIWCMLILGVCWYLLHADLIQYQEADRSPAAAPSSAQVWGKVLKMKSPNLLYNWRGKAHELDKNTKPK